MRHDHERGSSAVGSTATSLLQQVDGGDEAPDVGGGVIGPRTHKTVNCVRRVVTLSLGGRVESFGGNLTRREKRTTR